MRLIACFVTLGLATAAAQFSDRSLAKFPDGTQIEIHSEATGSTQLSAHGSIGIGPGTGKQDMVNRVVLDRDNNALFAYNLEASRGAAPDTVMIRIDPLSTETEKGMLTYWKDPRLPKIAGSHIPTVAAVREFPNVKIGEVVTLDILQNPATGEKIYDVLQPLLGEPGPLTVTNGRPRQEISLRDIAVRVNNRTVPAAPSWMIGNAIRVDIPGHGAWVIALQEPHVPEIYAFAAAGRADGKMLRLKMDGDTVEITSGSSVLTQAASGVLWVYHDAHYRSRDQSNTVKLQTAESADWLIPKK